MRVVDVDELLKRAEKTDLYLYKARRALRDVIQESPIIEVVSLEDYRSMEQTAYKLTQALAEAEPVKHGRWIGKPIAGYSTVRCSVCKEAYPGNMGRWNYCPNCGAKMDEVEE